VQKESLRSATVPFIQKEVEMQHLTEGQMRAYIDGEAVEGISKNEIAAHLAACPACQAQLGQIKARAAFVEKRFAALSASLDEKDYAAKLSGRRALANLNQKIEQKETSIMTKLFSKTLRPVWIGLLILIAAGSMLSFPAGRAWAGEFLGLFRVQQVRVVPVDFSGMAQFNNDSTLEQEFGDLISKSITIRKEPTKPRLVSSAEEAAQLAGFTIRLPSPAPEASQFFIQSGSAYDILVDRKRAQSLLDELGRSDLVLPESLDGSTISVDIPDGLVAAYGECPKVVTDEDKQKADEENIVKYPECTVLFEIPSPTINTPPDMNIAELAEIGLEFSGMKPEEARAYTESVDWTSSMIVPIPKQNVTVEEVTVDGVEGTIVKRESGYAPRYVLLWIKDGITYAINGYGLDASKAIEMANSLK
jgi:hypothetical protein